MIYCQDCANSETTISSLRSQVAALTEAPGKAEEALKKISTGDHEHDCYRHGDAMVADEALAALATARQAAIGTGPEGRGEGE